MLTLAAVLARLSHPRQTSPSQWFALCPCHAEQRGSLSVRIAPGLPPFSCHCFGCGAGTRRVLEALGLALDGVGPVAAPEPEPAEGTPAWYEAAHREAVDQERRAAMRRGGEWGRVRSEGADLHRWCLDRCDALHRAAERLGPDDPAAWDMLELAARIEAERRLLEIALDRP